VLPAAAVLKLYHITACLIALMYSCGSCRICCCSCCLCGSDGQAAMHIWLLLVLPPCSCCCCYSCLL